jgi:hypothetical protein
MITRKSMNKMKRIEKVDYIYKHQEEDYYLLIKKIINLNNQIHQM